MNANTTSAEPPRLVDALCPLHSTYIQKCTVHFIYTVQYIFFSLSATCFLGTRYSNLVTLEASLIVRCQVELSQWLNCSTALTGRYMYTNQTICWDQRIYISDRTHSTPQRLPKMCPRNLFLLCL